MHLVQKIQITQHMNDGHHTLQILCCNEHTCAILDRTYTIANAQIGHQLQHWCSHMVQDQHWHQLLLIYFSRHWRQHQSRLIDFAAMYCGLALVVNNIDLSHLLRSSEISCIDWRSKWRCFHYCRYDYYFCCYDLVLLMLGC